MRLREYGWRLIAVLVVLSLAAAGCGDDSGEPTASEAITTDTGGSTGGGESAEPDEGAEHHESAEPDESADASAGGDVASEEAASPIIIGAAIDLTSNMAPFDAPALAAAKITIANINAAGGIGGRQIQLEVVDTELDPAQTKAAALDLLDRGAEILITTCDVDFATPAIQEGINAGVLTVAPCIGTDQMGPSRFGDVGRLAFTIGNLAQDEGAVLAEHAYAQGLRTAIVVPDNLLVYFQNVCDAFSLRFEELGGVIASNEGFTSFDGSVNNLATVVTGAGDADVIALCTFPPDITTAVSGIRSAGVDISIYSPWSGDGTFWHPEGLTNFTFSAYASIFGDDPSAEVNDLIAAMTDAGSAPGTGGFLTGAAAIQAIAAAIEQAGTTDGEALADQFESFDGLATISGDITLSPQLHTVTGREYRIITVTDGVPAFVELMAASSPAR